MPTLDEQTLAANYGFAYSVLQSNPELKNAFDQAVRETWTPDKFVAAVRNTNWFKLTSENDRNAQILRASDPATWNNRLDQTKSRVGLLAAQYGARLDGHDLNRLADWALSFGWDDNQLRQQLAGYVKFATSAPTGGGWGLAGTTLTELRDFARDMGIQLGDPQLQSWTTAVVRGDLVIDDVKGMMRDISASKYVAFKDRIIAGETMASIAEPYRQAQAAMWETNPDARDVYDPMIQKALTRMGPEGKPQPQSLWEFEIDLRKHSLYNKTSKAQDEYMATGRQVLKDFGLQV